MSPPPRGDSSVRTKLVISTRTFVSGLLAVGLLASLHAPAAEASVSGSSPANRAEASYRALDQYFDAGQGLLLEEYPNTQQNSYSYVWPYSQASIAAENLAGMAGARPPRARAGRKRLDGYQPYWDSAPTPPGDDSHVRPHRGHEWGKFSD